MHSERAWLFGLRLLGPFVYVPRTTLNKRHIDGSVSRDWVMTSEVLRNVTDTMCGQADDLISDLCTSRPVQGALRERMNELLNISSWIEIL